MKKKILISTGGSGGHVIPAMAFYDHFKVNFDVFFVVDKRGSRFINGNKYTGEMTNGLLHGQGKMELSDGITYNGTYKYGDMENGVMTSANGLKFAIVDGQIQD